MSSRLPAVCHVGRQAIPCACFDALEHALGFTFRKSRELVKSSARVWLGVTVARNSRKLHATCSVGTNIAVMQMTFHCESVC